MVNLTPGNIVGGHSHDSTTKDSDKQYTNDPFVPQFDRSLNYRPDQIMFAKYLSIWKASRWVVLDFNLDLKFSFFELNQILVVPNFTKKEGSVEGLRFVWFR